MRVSDKYGLARWAIPQKSTKKFLTTFKFDNPQKMSMTHVWKCKRILNLLLSHFDNSISHRFFIDAKEAGTDNRNILDDGKSQKLTRDDIETLKEQGLKGQVQQ